MVGKAGTVGSCLLLLLLLKSGKKKGSGVESVVVCWMVVMGVVWLVLVHA